MEPFRLHRPMMSKVKTESLGRDERAGLVDGLPQYVSQGGVEQMRRRVIALGITASLARHPGGDAAEPKRAGEWTDGRGTAVDLPDVVDVHSPAVTRDLTAVGDLTARLRVEWRLAQEDRDPAIGQMAHGRYLGLDLDGVIADKRTFRGTFAGRQLPLRDVGQRIGTDAELPGFPLVLRTFALASQRLLEARDIDGVAALARHELRQVDRKTISVIELERVLAADRAAHVRAPVGGQCGRDLIEARQAAFDCRKESLLLDACCSEDVLGARFQFWIDVVHRLDDRFHHVDECWFLASQEPGMANSAT